MSSTGTVLVVEDDPQVRRAVCTLLERYGFDVLEARDVDHALELFAARFVDVVVSDVQMGRMNGPALVAAMRARRAEVPVLFVSGDPGSVLHGKPLPPRTRFLAKPFAPAELLVELGALLPAGDGMTILLVEDDAPSRASLARMLRHAGHRVIAAATAAEALEHAANEPIEVLVTDLSLPDRRGDELAAEIVRTMPQVTIVYVSGGRAFDPEVPGRVLEKPVDRSALLSCLPRPSKRLLPETRQYRVSILRRQANGDTSEFVIRGITPKRAASQVASALWAAESERGSGVWSDADPEVWVAGKLVGRLAMRGDVAELTRRVLEALDGA